MEQLFAFIDAVVAVLLNSLWEGALIALVAFAIVRLAPNLSASTRYAIWWVSLLAAFAVPLLSTIPVVLHGHSAPTPVAESNPSTTVPALAKWNGVHVGERYHPSSPIAAPPTQERSAPGLPRLTFAIPGIAGSLAFAAWAVVALAIVLRLAFALYQLEKLKRDAMPLPVEYREKMLRWLDAVKGSRDVRLCVSDATSVPIAVGLFDAMILIPKHLLELLAQDEVDQISLHELAHLRRSDDWTNGIQRLIQALLFFNPAVQLIGQQLDLEREVACDDWVLSQTGAVRPYALCLTKMAESTSWPHRAVPAPGVFITRKAISIRIERLLRAGRNVRTSISLGAASIAAVAIVAIGFIVVSVEPSFAFTQSQGGTGTQSQTAQTQTAQTQTTKAQSAHAKKPAVSSPSLPAPAAKPQPEPTSIERNPMHVAVNVPSAPDIDVQAAVAEHLKALHVAPNPRVALVDERNKDGGCTGCDFSGVNWSGRDLHGQAFAGADFTNANLSNANLSGANLTGCTFENTNLNGANLRNANLMGCDLKGSDLRNADLTGATMTGADIESTKFGAVQARTIISSCEGCDFSGINLSGADLSNLRIVGVDFSHADLENVNFSGSVLKGVDLNHSNMRGANVRGAKLTGCDVSEANVDGVDFSQAQLTGVDFSSQR